jgi:hypothetical protein
MRKIAILSMIGLSLLACSISDISRFMPVPATQALAATLTPFPTWTMTPAVPPTLTYTPTMIGQKPSPTVTGTPTWTPTMSGSPTMVNTIPGPRTSSTPLPADTGFETIDLSATQIVVGSCGVNEVTFDVQVSKPDKVESVVIFLKLRDKVSGDDSGWDRGNTLDYEGEGHYTYTLKSSDFATPANASWVVYQLVGTDDEQALVARSQVYAEKLTIVKCP